ncbi:MAG: DUF2868 domain-containing protein [Gammaproteobacteria bacterium]|nr:DUF2868 domain-containing protein [Gammaproteobacteria bacterium]
MLGAVVDIRRWLHADRQTPHLDRLERDRDIGRVLPVGATANERVLAWWAEIAPVDVDSTGGRLERTRRAVTAALTVIGVLLGASLAGVAFGYEGHYPVNLFALLGVLVGMPLVLLLFSLLLLLPGRLPVVSTVQDVLAGMNVGRWVGAWLDRYAQTDLFAAFPGGRKTSAFARWQLVVFSQWLAIGFFVGVLAVAWLLVAFTDLAFGWSTTLQIEATSVHRWFVTLAAPWSTWLAVATPELTLVETSRFFRLEEGGMPAARAARLGEWWPFVLMIVLTYGLVPRMVLLGVAVWRLGVASRSLLRDDPEVTALIDRLTLPPVDYQGEPADTLTASGESLSVPTLPGVFAAEDDSTLVMIWNGALPESAANVWLVDRFGIRQTKVLGMGVLQDRGFHLEQLEGIPHNVRRLVIFTKGWEPPLLEFSDFLDLIREVVGDAASLVLVPIDVTGKQVLESERDVWAQALARRRDSGLYAVAADIPGAG